MCNVLFGYRYSLEEDKEEFQKLLEFNHTLGNLSFDNDPINHVSWIKYIYHTKGFKRYLENVNARDEFVANQLKKHLQTFRDEKIRDFTDMLIRKKEIKGNFSEIDGRVRNEIEMILGDMLLAGTDTSRSLLEWSILYLLHWPNLQELIYNEIVDHVGKGRYPFLKDRENLHICNAFISASLRYTSFTPILVPHKTLENEMIGPYKIPKGTIIVYNAWKIHHDEKHWQDPFKFDHTRWLDENNKYKTNKSFAPFSLGVRSCPGEPLSYKEIFVFLTRLVCDFKLLPEVNKPLPDLKGITNTVIITEPYFIKVEERKQ